MPKMPLPPAESIQLDSLAEVARGGMGSVELARALDGRLAGQVLAVKRLHPNIAEDPDFVSMFLDETWMTAALKSPNVAQVVAWGNDDKGMFLAIELVQGVSLSRLLKEAQQNQEPFAERTVAFICSQICAGLVAAHSLTTPDGTPLQLVHRDLTPANVLVSFDGMVKIIDFGIAKAEERISHTRTGQLKGKPAYMAPEQQRGDAVDARADIFAFGVVMFELLAGRRPWTAKGAFDVMMEISNDPHPDLGELRRGLNPEFIAIVHKCLQKKPDQRFQTVAEIKTRLDAWLTAKGFSSDDQQSLASFVLRNSQPQVLWWQEALRGEHSKKKSPTFKELEEKIDEEREKAQRPQKAPPRRPPPPAAGTVPMSAYRGPGMVDMSSGPARPPPNVGSAGPVVPAQYASSLTGQPPSGPGPASPRGTGFQPAPTSVRAGFSGTGPMPSAAVMPGAGAANAAPNGSMHHGPAPNGGRAAPSSGPAPAPTVAFEAQAGAPPPSAYPGAPASRRLVTGAGTEFLAISPFASGEIALPPTPRGPPPAHYANAPVAGPQSGPAHGGPQTPRPLETTVNDPSAQQGYPNGPGAGAMHAMHGMGSPTGAEMAATVGSSAPPAGRVPGRVPTRPKNRVPLVIALCVAVTGGVAVGAWLALGQPDLGHDVKGILKKK